MGSTLENKKVLITSGPTIEKIDPVRFISNFSSGKMGCAIAKAFLNVGADVTVVSGPVNVSYPKLTHVENIMSAHDMLNSCEKLFCEADILVCAAAVSDYRPKTQFSEKLKKGTSDKALEKIELVKNPDILKTLASKKRRNQLVIGFCAETNNLIENAKKKIESKGCDIIVANDVSDGKVFGKKKTSAHIIVNSGELFHFQSVTKDELAEHIVEICIQEQCRQK